MAIAANIWADLKLTWFRAWIGAFILCFLLWRRYKPKLRNPPIWSYAVLGLAAGLLAIFVGATGPFLAPFFLRDDFDNEQVIATKAVCQTWLHLLKIPAFLALSFDYVPYAPVLAGLVVAVIGGTYFGKHLLSRISKERFVFWFQLVLAAPRCLPDRLDAHADAQFPRIVTATVRFRRGPSSSQKKTFCQVDRSSLPPRIGIDSLGPMMPA